MSIFSDSRSGFKPPFGVIPKVWIEELNRTIKEPRVKEQYGSLTEVARAMGARFDESSVWCIKKWKDG